MFGVAKEMKIAVVGALLASAVFADGERNHYQARLKQNEGMRFWLNGVEVANSTVVADKGCDVTVVDMRTDNPGLQSHYEFHSWEFANTNASTGLNGPWCDSYGSFTIGEGGVTMAANNLFRLGYKNEDRVRVKLSESQTWSGPATGTTWAEFTVGWKQYWNGYYWQTTIQALKDIVWTLDGRIKVSLTASNDLSNVDIVVNPNARLFLIRQCKASDNSNLVCNVHLNAKSLTLKGGDTGSSVALFTVGAANPETIFGTTSAPSSFDDATVSPKVNLVDGASITGGTFDYAVSELNVSGGDSTISGTVTFKKKVGIDIAANASLAFTGSLSADEGAGVELTGGGAMLFSKAIAIPVSGDGTIRCDPGADGETVLSDDLSSFTGTIHVATGTLVILPDAQLNPTATITTAEGASYKYLTAADFGDYTENGKWYYRDSDGIRHQYLFQNGFSSNIHLEGGATFREIPDVVASNRWRNGSVFVVDQRFSGGIGNDTSLEMEGLLVTEDATVSGTSYFDQDWDFTIGERGIDLRKICSFYIWKRAKYFRLSKSQTWRGPAAAALSASPAYLYIGGASSYYYPTGSITPLEDGLELTIEGDLNVYLYYPTNNMTTAYVTVKAPARLTLANPGGMSAPYKNWSGRLNARQLTFDGGSEGLAMPKSDLITAELLAPRVVLRNGATFSVSGKSWTGVTLVASGASTTNFLTGTHTLLDDVMNLEAEAGATLDISAATFKLGDGVAGGISATGAGTIRLSVNQFDGGAGGFTVNGPSVVLTGGGEWTNSLAAAAGLAIDSDEYVSVTASALAGYGATAIDVTSGTLFLDSVAALPPGCKVVTSGTGALALYDMTGFDADVHMGGTKNIRSDALYVTDEARENETLTVPAGQTLHIAGSGLKSSSTVTLEDGASIIFHKTATIYAPVTLTGAATIRTIDASAEGTFAGAVTAGNVASQTGNCNIWAPGGIVFAGGAAIHKTPVCQRSGTIIIRDKEFSLRNSNGGFSMYEGYCLITNCTVVSIANGGTWFLDKTAQTGDVALEIAAGGTLKHGNNTRIYIGSSTNFESRLILNGGTFTHETYDTMYINSNGSGTYNGNGKGVFEFKAGEFRTQRRFITGFKPGSSVGYAKFIWSGGTWSTTSSGYPYRYNHLIESITANSGLEFIVSGTNCVLDLTYFQFADSISNFNNGVSTMVGMPGKKNVLSNLTFVRCTPNGMALDLNPEPSCDVEIVGDGEPVELGWVVPGTGGVVRCIGTASPLLANYVAPSGVTFENAYVNDSWNEGFTSATANDLVFDDGATYLLRTTAQGLPAIDFAGALVASGNVKYAVDASAGAIPVGDDTVIVRTGEGISGDGVWSAANARLGRMSSVRAEGDDLLFSYSLKGIVISIR